MLRNRKHFAAYIGVRDAQQIMMQIIADTEVQPVSHIAKQLNVSGQFVTIEIGDHIKEGSVSLA